MNARRVALLISVVLIGLASRVPGRVTADGIIVNDADALETLTIVGSSDLDLLITGVGPRFEVWYANDILYNSITPAPSGLQTLLGEVGDRAIIWYADSNRSHAITYPAGLTGDNTPPQISEVSVIEGDNSADINWTTDEFADSSVHFGTQPGDYSDTAYDPLYGLLHEIELTDINPCTTYYFKISSTDRSGNTAESSELSFSIQVPLGWLTAANDSPTELGSMTTLTATVDTGCGVLYSWAFGDGEVGNGEVVTHVYPTVGTFSAVVTATNSVSEDSATTTVMIGECTFLPIILRQRGDNT